MERSEKDYFMNQLDYYSLLSSRYYLIKFINNCSILFHLTTDIVVSLGFLVIHD